MNAKTGFRLGVWVGAGVLGAGMIASCAFQYDSDVARFVSSQNLSVGERPERFASAEASSRDAKVHPVTIEQIRNSYHSDGVSADEWLQSRRLAITGQLTAVSKDGRGWKVELVEIDPSANPDDAPSPDAAFRFTTRPQDHGRKFRAGDSVICTGQLVKRERGGELDFKGESVAKATE
jgi:hypothetical protein